MVVQDSLKKYEVRAVVFFSLMIITISFAFMYVALNIGINKIGNLDSLIDQSCSLPVIQLLLCHIWCSYLFRSSRN